MKREILMPLLLEAISRDNILPLTSTCNAKCLFCSHHQNPPGTRILSFPSLEERLIMELLLFLDRKRKIIIGESSSRLCEGEPFTHPSFLVILRKTRELFPETPVQVTTNGMYLDRETTTKLQEINGVGSLTSCQGPLLELVVSLNCISTRQRMDIMGDRSPGRILGGIELLREKGIIFHGSVVAVPHLTGWDELAETLYFLERTGAKTTRIFLPGFTRLAPKTLQFPKKLWEELHVFLEKARVNLAHPVTLEPPLKKKLEARVEGVISGSAAWHCGIQKDDILQRINGERIYTASEAFFRIQEFDNPAIDLQRAEPGGIFSKTVCLEKGKGESSGLVLARDLEFGDVQAVDREIERTKARRPLLLTSYLAEPLWKSALQKGLLPALLVVDVVASRFFGGNIACAGLLTVADFKEALLNLGQKLKQYDLVMVPLKPFNRQGFDLRGEHYRDLVSSFPGRPFSFL